MHHGMHLPGRMHGDSNSESSALGFIAFFAFMLVGGGLIALIIYLLVDTKPSDSPSAGHTLAGGGNPLAPPVASPPMASPPMASPPAADTPSGAPPVGSSPEDCVDPDAGTSGAGDGVASLSYKYRPGSKLRNYGGARATLYSPDNSYKHVVWPSGASKSPYYCVSERGECSSGAIPLSLIPAHITSMDVPEGYALVVSGVPNKGTITIPSKSFEHANPDSTHFGPGELAFSRNRDINAMIAQHTKALRFTLVRL